MEGQMKNKISNVTNSLKAKWAMLSAMVATTLPQVASANTTPAGGSDQPENVVQAVIEVVVNIFPLIGAFFVVAGVFKLIMAYRNDQPEAQTAAAKDIVIGAIFIVFRVFAWEPVSNVIF